SVASPCGTSEELRTRRWPFDSKNCRNLSRISFPLRYLPLIASPATFGHRKFCVSRTQHYYRALPKRQSRKTTRFPSGCGGVPQIMTMNSREAKDFLVQEIMQQAALHRALVADLERRRMYFTESEDTLEDPIELNTGFAA